MTVSRRKLLKTVGATGTIALAGCSNSGDSNGNTDSSGQGGGSTDGTTSQGTSGQSGQYHIGFPIMGLGGDPWMGAFRNGAEWYAQDHNLELTVTDGEFDSAKQINDAKRLIRQDVDAILTSPVQSDAAVTIVEQANAENIPVFTANSTASTGKVPMFTAFGNADAAASAAEVMAKRLEQRNGAREGTVVEVMLPQDTETFVQRHEGFVNQMKEYSDIEIVGQVQYDQTQQDAANKIATQLQRNDDFDGLYCPDLLSGLAAMSAFENQGVKKKIGNEGHITTVGLDAGPTTLEAIQNEFFDAAIDQPNLFYAPISMKYMTDYLDAGQDSSAIPEAGKELTADQLTIATGNKHGGINPWAEPLWAPGQIETLEFDDGKQTYFKTSSVTVTQENADAPYLWGNLA
ncbi:sugar ABC transporter substrate-binding protein [Haloarcula amylovorans]|uniref:sugar ABC transporter substrate-binding protein n=1 Tax=Haloarcula amylovorans TaxID=2562280 RepID=UPI00107660C0|nr:sugar ABC transporter substrate-binding protein [Halomicroarcula amylolytica]